VFLRGGEYFLASKINSGLRSRQRRARAGKPVDGDREAHEKSAPRIEQSWLTVMDSRKTTAQA